MSDLFANDEFVEVNGSQYNRRLTEQFVKDIEIAHAINPNSWCIHSAGGAPFLAVGFLNALSIQGPSDGYSYLISTEGIDERISAQVEPFFDEKRAYSDRPWAQNLRLSDEAVSKYAELFSEAHESGVRRLASEVAIRANRWKWHIDSFRTSLNDALGLAIPEPSYLHEIPIDLEMALDASLSRRAWKVYAGEKGQWWPEMLQNSVAYLPSRFKSEIDLTNLPQDEEGFVREVSAMQGVGATHAKAAWNLVHEMKQGDFVLAMKGYYVYGWGTITGSYEFVPSDPRSCHTRHANWCELIPQEVKGDIWRNYDWTEMFRGMTPSEITLSEFNGVLEMTGQSIQVPESSLGHSMTAKSTRSLLISTIRDQFAASGLHYTDAQIATFYTSLQTKGFVVLSGISGTGKSKIATGFVDMLSAPVETSTIKPQAEPADSSPSQTEKAQDTVIPTRLALFGRKESQLIIPKSYAHLFPRLPDKANFEVDVQIESHTVSGSLMHFYGRSGRELVSNIKGNLRTLLGSRRDGETLTLTPVRNTATGDLVKIILGETSDPEQIPSVSQRTGLSPNNHLFLSVRPDWRDSTSLLGYYNPLTQTYEWTEFLHFLLRARESYQAQDGLAWFVILDEMNLAHVEYYFADLLSVIESGRDEEGWTREPLRMTYPDTLDDDVPPHELKLPPNLYIIGTVNMDETTHAFSPKVLDRAFTIELADVDFTDYPIAEAAAGAATLTDDQKTALLQAFTREGRFALIDKKEIAQAAAEHSRIRVDLQALNELLQPHRMHFGYRVFDEIAQYLHNNDLNGMMPFGEAFDQAVFMKVLPKFTGSRARLQSPLHGVLAWAIDPASTARDDVRVAIAQFDAFYAGTAVEAWTGPPVFPTVASRVRDMLVALERDGFVSFG